jgi:hypothetical protein
MRMTVAQIDQRLARMRTETAPRRDLLTYRIDDTDRIIRRHPLVILAGGILLFFSLFAVIMSVAEKVLG